MPRILLLHASIGMGHQRAAQALGKAFGRFDDTTVMLEDTLDHASPFFRRAYAGMYLGLAGRAPALWSIYYSYTDRPRPQPKPSAYTRFRLLSTGLGVRGLPALLERARADAIVCTHFLPVEAMAGLRHVDLPPVYLVLTDYHAHQFWALGGVDRYFVPTPQAREQFVALGVPRQRVSVAGIPIDPAIAQPADRLATRRRLGLDPSRPVVTLIGSGLPAERVRAIASALIERLPSITLLIAAGRSQELADELADLEHAGQPEVRLLGAQPSLDPFVVASDLAIGKAGGLTVSEILARGVPLIVPTPVAGQERWNADHVAGAGAGLQLATAHEIAAAAEDLLANPDRRAAMARAARAIARPNAAQAIAAHVLRDLKEPRAFAYNYGNTTSQPRRKHA